MPTQETISRARRRRALFVVQACVVLAGLGLTGLPAAHAGVDWDAIALPVSCTAPQTDHGSATVDRVIDGDTVRLHGDVHVRLIGLDAPEFHHRDEARAVEPFAREARDALTDLLAAHDDRVHLVHDRERRDHYRRSLAHLFTPNGRSITALMLSQGLAVRLTIPPNEWNLDCYRDVERTAREAGLGIWSQPRYRLHEAHELPRDAEGFQRVQGRVARLGASSRAHWINLEGDVALRIDRADLHHFPDLDLGALENARVSARGYVYNYRGQPRMRIRHPADLEIMDP